MAKKKSKKWIVVTLILIGIIAGVAYAYIPRKDSAIEVTVEPVKKRTLTSIVTATGKLFPEVEVKISSEAAGEIIELPVVEGQAVKKGDLLARIKPDTYEAQVRQREAAIASARALSLQSKAEMLQSTIDLQRVEELFSKGFVAQAELDTARTTVEVRKASYEASLYQIKQQETHLDEARELLQKTTILAPMDGIISSLDAELGERVVGTGQFEGTEIMRVADLSNMEVRIDVSENDIVNVKVGDNTRIEVDAIPDKPFQGVVKEIASSAKKAEGQGGSNSGSQEEITTFEVRIRIKELDPRIRPGMTATADIETATVVNAISVPLQSVTVRERSEVEKSSPTPPTDAPKADEPLVEGQRRPQANNRKGRDSLLRVVFIKVGEEVKARAVTTGISDNTHIEIKEGLKEDEVVVSGSYTAISRELKDGAKVRIKEKGNNKNNWKR